MAKLSRPSFLPKHLRGNAPSRRRQRSTKFQELLDILPDPLLIHCNDIIVYANTACAQLLATNNVEQLIGTPFSDIAPANEMAVINKGIEVHPRKGPSPSSMEHLLQAFDGSLVEVEAIAVPCDWNGTPALEVIFRTLDDRGRAEQTPPTTEKTSMERKLLESEERYRLLLNSTAEGIFGVDVNGICTFCNPAAARLLGYRDPNDLLGQPFHATHHHSRPDGAKYPQSECSVFQSLKGEGIHVEQEQYYRVDGTYLLVDCWAYPVFKDSRVIGAVVTFLDVTQRARTEHLLWESEENFRSLIQNAPYGIYRAAPNGTVLSANPALAAMLGYESVHDVLSLNLFTDVYLYPEQRAALLLETLKNGRTYDTEVEWKKKDGTTFTVRLNGTPVFDDSGQAHNFEVFAEDVTESKQLERKFWQAQKLEAAGRLAGGVAHDFNNVLMIVSSYADLIIQRNQVDEKSIGYAKHIHQAALKASNVTQQLLAFSRRQILEPEVLNPNAVLKDLSKILHKLLGEDINLVVDADPVIRHVKADRGQLEQIIINLIVNSRDAMPKGGQLTITTRNVDVDAAFAKEHSPMIPGAYVLVSVADSGVGMDLETKTRLFEPFFTTKERDHGTGLGLATVYGIVKQSGGYISVRSEPGQGATFDIYFPSVADALPSAATPYSPEAGLRGSERILLVEDEEHLLAATREFLESNGYSVIATSNAAEALRVSEAHSETIDLLITDVIMPGRDGVELAEALRSTRPEIRVLFMSGYTDRLVEGLGEDAALLRKPFSQQMLASRIRELLSSCSELS